MPVSYHFDATLHVIEITCTGVLTLAEIGDYFARVEQDATIPYGAVEIVDLSGVTRFAVSSREAGTMPISYERANSVKGLRATLLIGPSDSNFGMGRMVQARFATELPEHPMFVVRSREEALQKVAQLPGA